MTKTVINTNIGQSVIGYMLNAPFSQENQIAIAEVQNQLSERFGDSLWCTPPETLHITLFDWLAPLVEYQQDKDALFKEIYESYNTVVERALGHIGPIKVQFYIIQVGPSAVFIKGSDNGQFERIRAYFLDNVTLLPHTKLPPTIIHSTIARFKAEVVLEPVQTFLSDVSIEINQTIPSFRLVRETIDPMLAFEVVKEYPLIQ